MQIQCPHRQNPIELVETPLPREIVCTVCGSSINLDPGHTFTMAPEATRRRIGRFELLEAVGLGAHGTVYKARDTQLDRIVAIKVPRVTALPSQYDVDRFPRESRSTAQLKHPNLAWLYVTAPEQVRNAQRALELAHKAIELDPTNWSYGNTLGVAYYRTGQFQKAAETLLHVIESNPDGGSAFDLFFVAMSYQRLGDVKKANEFYEQAIVWWRKQANLPDGWKAELEAFRAEAARVLGLAPADKAE